MMVKYLRNINVILGKNKKIITNSEKKNQSFIRKYLVAKKNIFKNEKFDFENLTSKRTGLKQGLTPIKFIKIKGKRSRFNFLKDDLIRL
jgi:sialic acid synthase SpsE